MIAERLLATFEQRDDRYTIGRVFFREDGEQLMQYLVAGPAWFARAMVDMAMSPVPVGADCVGEAMSAACVRKAPALVRCWCPQLSVLDCEVNGERWVFHVPARAANDTETSGNATQHQNGEKGLQFRGVRRTLRAKKKPNALALTDWLRDSEVTT